MRIFRIFAWSFALLRRSCGIAKILLNYLNFLRTSSRRSTGTEGALFERFVRDIDHLSRALLFPTLPLLFARDWMRHQTVDHDLRSAPVASKRSKQKPLASWRTQLDSTTTPTTSGRSGRIRTDRTGSTGAKDQRGPSPVDESSRISPISCGGGLGGQCI